MEMLKKRIQIPLSIIMFFVDKLNEPAMIKTIWMILAPIFTYLICASMMSFGFADWQYFDITTWDASARFWCLWFVFLSEGCLFFNFDFRGGF